MRQIDAVDSELKTAFHLIMRVIVAFLLIALGGCAENAVAAPEPTNNCEWDTATPLAAHGYHCDIAAMRNDRVDVTFNIGAHTLRVDINDTIPGDPYNRVLPTVTYDGVDVHCGENGTSGVSYAIVSASKWWIDIGPNSCNDMKIVAHLEN